MRKFLSKRVSLVSCLRGQISIEFIISILLMLAVFMIGIAIFEVRQEQNSESFDLWGAQIIAHRMARNINSAYLMDGNSAFTDPVFWNKTGQRIEVTATNVRVWWNTDNFYSFPILAPIVNQNVSDFNGLITFRKQDGNVIISQ